MLKKEILAQIEVLCSETQETFFYPGLKGLKKSALVEKLSIIQGIIGTEKRKAKIIRQCGLTFDDLFRIAAFGTDDKIENEIVIANQVIRALVEDFEGLS